LFKPKESELIQEAQLRAAKIGQLFCVELDSQFGLEKYFSKLAEHSPGAICFEEIEPR
jgi:hypothetical protein